MLAVEFHDVSRRQTIGGVGSRAKDSFAREHRRRGFGCLREQRGSREKQDEDAHDPIIR